MSKLKTFTHKDIVSWEPCYPPSKYLTTDWQGTALDIIKNQVIPWEDRLWVVCREEIVYAKTLRLFAVFCARQVEHLLTDELSKNAIDVAERYAYGKATYEELREAGDAAWAVASDAASDAARAAAYAASDAARVAAWAAAYAARDAAWAAAQEEQKNHLIKLLEGE